MVLDLPKSVGEEFIRAFDVRLIEETTQNWLAWYGLLLGLVEREGHAKVPTTLVVDGIALGNWVVSQRLAFKDGRLDPERAARLEALPGWSWAPFDDQWEESFAALARFVTREGHARVLRGRADTEAALGNWVGIQRAIFAKGRLDPDRAARLAALPGWTWNVHSDRFEDGFAALAEFVACEGHAKVSSRVKQDGFALGLWVANRRSEYSAGSLAPERIARLEALPGWTWDPFNDSWEARFTALTAFVSREGHARVPAGHLEAGCALGHWVTYQRRARSTGRLVPERVARLEALPGWSWDTKWERWEEGFAALKRFVECEGHVRVPTEFWRMASPSGIG